MDVDPSLKFPSDPRLQLVGDASAALFELGSALRRLWVEHASAVGVPVGEIKVLLTMRVGEDAKMSVLAARLGTDASNVTGLIDKLISRGAIVRVDDPTDRRVNPVRITDHGLRVRNDFWNQVTHDAGPLTGVRDHVLRVLGELRA